VNRFEETLWFRKEPFEELVSWIDLVAAIDSEADPGPDGASAEREPRRVGADRSTRIARAEALSGYRVESLFEIPARPGGRWEIGAAKRSRGRGPVAARSAAKRVTNVAATPAGVKRSKTARSAVEAAADSVETVRARANRGKDSRSGRRRERTGGGPRARRRSAKKPEEARRGDHVGIAAVESRTTLGKLDRSARRKPPAYGVRRIESLRVAVER